MQEEQSHVAEGHRVGNVRVIHLLDYYEWIPRMAVTYFKEANVNGGTVIDGHLIGLIGHPDFQSLHVNLMFVFFLDMVFPDVVFIE